MSILFYIGLMLLSGLLFGRLAKLCGFPNVTGYLVAGILIGPHVFKILSFETVNSIAIVSEMALGFIALTIGAEFKASYFKEIGLTSFIIALFGALFPIIFIIIGLLVFGFDFSLAIMLGVTASATAPAATVMVIRQYQANSPVTKTFLSVVAIDDAIALVLFGFAVAIVKSMVSGSKDVLMLILNPFIELGLSVILGVVFAFLLVVPLKFFKKVSNRMCAIVGVLFLTSALSNYFGASLLLTCMVLGATIANITKEADSVFRIADTITPPIFMLFFVLSGAQLDIYIVPTIGVIGIIYLIMRTLGKLFGAWLGAVIAKAPKTIKKYLGLTLLPQAGVAIGLTLVVDQVLPEYSASVRAVVLCAVLIFELIGPIASKYALAKAGEIEYS